MNYKELGRRGFLKCAAAGAIGAGLTPFGAIGRASAASRMDAGAPSETALGAACASTSCLAPGSTPSPTTISIRRTS